MRLFISILFYLLTSFAQGQSSAFLTDMNGAVKSFDAATTQKEYQAVFLSFESLATIHSTEWLTYYYMSLIKSRMSLQKMGNAEELANQAIKLIEKAKNIQINEEILCAESLAYTAKMSVSPYTRWLRLEHKIKAPLSIAKKINKENPRIYVLEANLHYKMPVLLGGGCSSAFSIALVAADKLAAYSKLNKPYAYPHWGTNIIHSIIADCKKD